MRAGWVAVVMVSLLAGCQPPPPPTPEQAFCERLFETFERYLMPRGLNERRDPQADLAIDLCRRGRTQEGIAILEAKLQRAQWPLPRR